MRHLRCGNYALDNDYITGILPTVMKTLKQRAISEERLGHIIKWRRKEIFLSTKIASREPDKAKAETEESLKRLQTDYVDMLKIHAVETEEDAADICRKGGVLDVISKYKEEGITRFIGFSGHGNAKALKAMVDTGQFDSMLFANESLQRRLMTAGYSYSSRKGKRHGNHADEDSQPKETNTGNKSGGSCQSP
jgi:predicted aldo/keto reductase-like oxidoreductase